MNLLMVFFHVEQEKNVSTVEWKMIDSRARTQADALECPMWPCA